MLCPPPGSLPSHLERDNLDEVDKPRDGRRRTLTRYVPPDLMSALPLLQEDMDLENSLIAESRRDDALVEARIDDGVPKRLLHGVRCARHIAQILSPGLADAGDENEQKHKENAENFHVASLAVATPQAGQTRLYNTNIKSQLLCNHAQDFFYRRNPLRCFEDAVFAH